MTLMLYSWFFTLFDFVSRFYWIQLDDQSIQEFGRNVLFSLLQGLLFIKIWVSYMFSFDAPLFFAIALQLFSFPVYLFPTYLLLIHVTIRQRQLCSVSDVTKQILHVGWNAGKTSKLGIIRCFGKQNSWIQCQAGHVYGNSISAEST